jgi:hypothetical protein
LTSREDPEIASLWASVFGEPPPVIGGDALMLEILVRYLPPAPPYGSLAMSAPDAPLAVSGRIRRRRRRPRALAR